MKKTIKIPFKNYITLIVLFLIVIFSYSWVLKIYRVNKITQSSVLTNNIAIISVNDLNDYIIENPNTIIYLPTLIKTNNEFENKFLELILNNHYEEKIVYLNIGGVSYKKIKERIFTDYSDNSSIFDDEFATLLLIKDGRIVNSLLIKEGYEFRFVAKFISDGEEVLNND